MAAHELRSQVAALLASVEATMRGTTVLLRSAAHLLRQEPILGLDSDLLDTLAAVTDANRGAVARMEKVLTRVREDA